MVGVDASRLSPGTRITLSFYEAPWKRDVPVELVVQERPKLYGIYDMVLTEADFEELNEQIEHGNKPRLFMLRRNKLRGGAHEHNHANAVKKDNVDQKDREEQDAVHQTLNAQALKKIQEVEESTSNAQGAGK
ncbi:hypothetical protein H2198_009093 [Neophaeococcomyces mojaviensis]|uniref:Uncharacterized protein n=1 Tax=Neophaeococcomyces mojaviensis TaxID=3383035 RepID=A0ACC2ZVB0_9EURO|nr:hypothetical protein H2198_009093 [Knufia sp. JES_112]